MNNYEARWNNALRIANAINQYIDDGYIVLDHHNSPVPRMTIGPDSISIIHEDVLSKSRMTYMIFENNPDYDHGVYTTIREFNDTFKDWTIAKKVDMGNILSRKGRT
jgi:hypothetical protein